MQAGLRPALGEHDVGRPVTQLDGHRAIGIVEVAERARAGGAGDHAAGKQTLGRALHAEGALLDDALGPRRRLADHGHVGGRLLHGGAPVEDAVVVGVSHGPGVSSGNQAEDKTHLYAGANLNTPLKDLTFGVAYDAVFNTDALNPDPTLPASQAYTNYGYSTAIAGYISYKVSEKLRTSVRAEYAHGKVLGVLNGGWDTTTGTNPQANFDKVFALTGTVTYDLWANVLTRLEVRWDHATGLSKPFGDGTVVPGKENSVLVAANMVYKF